MDRDPEFDNLLAQGLEASRQERPEAAIALFSQASARVPSSGIPFFLIGSEHAAAGEVEAAETAFANAVLLAPGFALARYQLGLLQFSAGRAAVAVLTWAPLLAAADDDPLAHFARGFAALARDQLAPALQHFRSGLACPQVQPAVAADIAKVVEAVESLAARPAAEQEAAPASAHVLLGAYSRGLH